MSESKTKTNQPAQKEEQKVNENRPKTQQNNDRKPRENKNDNQDRKPREGDKGKKSDFLSFDLRKPRRDDYEKFRKPKYEREDFSKIEINLDTQVPELPKKGQKVSQPDDEALFKQLKQIDDQIDEVYDKANKFVQEIRSSIKSTASKGKTVQNPVRAQFNDKLDLKKQLYDDFNLLKDQYQQLQDKFDKSNEQLTQIKLKLKNFSTKDQIASELKELQEQQKHGNITIQEEKVIIKKISELQKALPYVEPYDKLNVEVQAIKKEKDALNKKKKEAYEKIAALKEELNGYSESLNKIRDESKQLFQEAQPQIDKKLNEVKPILENLVQQKKQLKDAHYKAYEDYHQQEELVKKIEYIKKRKAYLLRKQQEEQQKQEQEEKRKEELSQINENPYKEEIALCQLLIDYCTKLQPQQVQQKEEVKQKVDLSETLKNNDEWKKEKVTEISFKKDEELNEFALSNNKSKKGKKGQGQQKPQTQQPTGEQPREVLLNHQIEILQFFEQLTIPAPLLMKQLEETIKLLSQKKKYFEELPVDENTGYIKPSLKEEEEQQQQQKQQQKKKKVQETFNLQDEDFPDIQ